MLLTFKSPNKRPLFHSKNISKRIQQGRTPYAEEFSLYAVCQLFELLEVI